ncbi:MAG: hypothetical protein WC763_07415 [Candidatus Paceibacterota bacterium]|jgi:hypothetical protein
MLESTVTQAPERTLHLTPALALELWREASKLEVGLRVPISPKDIEKIKPMMYAARKAVIEDEPELGSLMLCVAPGVEEIWLVRKSVEAP